MEENENWKEEYLKRAEERVRAVEAAQARIDALIARAGGPMMVARNVQESEEEKHDDTIQALFDIGDYKNGGDLTVWIRELTDTIDRLEAALYNTLNERDQLKKDLHEAATKKGFLSICTYCAQKDVDYFDEPCNTCLENSKRPNFEWRGVQEGENDGSKK